MLTIEQAVEAIRLAPDRISAGGIRNDVAMEAMQMQRPESDADAVRAAFLERWGHELENSHRQTQIGPPITGYWGE